MRTSGSNKHKGKLKRNVDTWIFERRGIFDQNDSTPNKNSVFTVSAALLLDPRLDLQTPQQQLAFERSWRSKQKQ